MFKILTIASLALAMPAAVLADMAADLDADGDGAVSMSEFNEAMPDAGTGLFAEIDTDANGVLSADEIAAARDDGVLPAASSDG